MTRAEREREREGGREGWREREREGECMHNQEVSYVLRFKHGAYFCWIRTANFLDSWKRIIFIATAICRERERGIYINMYINRYKYICVCVCVHAMPCEKEGHSSAGISKGLFHFQSIISNPSITTNHLGN
jgi:hypothetical protein